MLIRPSVPSDFAAMLAIINDAAQVYRGVMPVDRWHEPYMPADELMKEITAGVVFWVAEEEGHLLGVMAIQDRDDVALVRHAYIALTLRWSLLTVGGRKPKVTVAQGECIAFSGWYSSEYNG